MNNKKCILQVNTYDIGGGAENIALSLVNDLGKYESFLAVGYKRSNENRVIEIPDAEKNIWQKLWCYKRRLIKPYIGKIVGMGFLYKLLKEWTSPAAFFEHVRGIENFEYPVTFDLLNITSSKPDIVHCHNLHGGYFDLRALPQLSNQVPVVMTLHDAWLLSGHCAHSFECIRWKSGCGNCPDLSIYPAIMRDATAFNWQRKAEIYRNCSVHVVTPCQWLMDKVNQSMLKPAIKSAMVIPNGVDLRVFHPVEKSKARKDLGLPEDVKVLLFTANGIRKNIWKDYRTLRSTLENISKSGAKVLCIALGEKASPEYIGNIEIRFVAYQRDPEKVARYYQAADVYVHPARADTFPSTVLEALACGTPVVASAVGGIPEQVMDGKTGYLVPPGNSQMMAERINSLLADEKIREEMGKLAAQDSECRFGMQRMINDYLSLYEKILMTK